MDLNRILSEGYGPGAWHGADLKRAIARVSPAVAFRRPARGRHNIAELALHHAYYVHAVRGRLTGVAPEPFVLKGTNFFKLDGKKGLTWPQVKAVVDDQQQRLAGVVSNIEAGRVRSVRDPAGQLKLVLGITCHAIYHAGQIQLIKKL